MSVDPDTRIEAGVQRMLALSGRKRYQDALKISNELLQFDPEDDRVLYVRGQILFQLSRNDEAIECLERTRQFSPHSVRPIQKLAEIAVDQRDFTRARHLIEEALEMQPNNAENLSMAAHVLSRSSYFGKGDWRTDRKLAAEYAAEAIALEPDQAVHYYRAAEVADEQRDRELALRLVEDGLAVDPHHSNLLNLKGELGAKGKFRRNPFDFSVMRLATIERASRRLAENPGLHEERAQVFSTLWTITLRSIAESPLWLGIFGACAIGTVLVHGSQTWFSVLALAIWAFFLLIRLNSSTRVLRAANRPLRRRVLDVGKARHVRNALMGLSWLCMLTAAVMCIATTDSRMLTFALLAIVAGLVCAVIASVMLSTRYPDAAREAGGYRATLDTFETARFDHEGSQAFLVLRLICVTIAAIFAQVMIRDSGMALAVVYLGLGCVVFTEVYFQFNSRRVFQWVLHGIPKNVELPAKFKPPRRLSLILTWLCVALSLALIAQGLVSLLFALRT